MIAALAGASHDIGLAHDLGVTALSRIPVGQYVRVVVIAVVAPAAVVERNARVAGIHDAVGTYLIGTFLQGRAHDWEWDDSRMARSREL